MSESTGIILTAGIITAANEAVFSPLTGHGTPWKDFNWRILPATGILALLLAGLDKASPQAGKGIAVIALVTVIFTRFGNAPSPAENLVTVLGYQGTKK